MIYEIRNSDLNLNYKKKKKMNNNPLSKKYLNLENRENKNKILRSN